MHQAMILLVKSQTRMEAGTKALKFLDRYYCDPWNGAIIGGRYSGLLTGYDVTDDPTNWDICSLCNGTGFQVDLVGFWKRDEDPSFTCTGCGYFDYEKDSWVHGAAGPGLCAKSPTEWKEVDDDIMPLCDERVRSAVTRLAQNWEADRLRYIAERSQFYIARGNRDMILSELRRREAILDDEFSADSVLFDTERCSNTMPDSFDGYWAVLLDLHT